MACKLLLIEDDEVAVYVTCQLLRQCGFTADIDVVKDGREALDYLSCDGCYASRIPENPALIVLERLTKLSNCGPIVYPAGSVERQHGTRTS